MTIYAAVLPRTASTSEHPRTAPHAGSHRPRAARGILRDLPAARPVRGDRGAHGRHGAGARPRLAAPPAHPRAPRVVGGAGARLRLGDARSEEHTSELQSLTNLVCRLLLEKK